ncbi:substrate-binding domain-containing protein [Actinoplanes sp. NBRC 103695]|uniref:molybdate ABC transporter substrate-binding protein n=1 Tax=Actinoplanes sp. NBRC 103695 TaxID=3032202 RepID=UPI0024A29F41|nr:substrate-binding domain-containing protein [Actinoplanes sp. NBRC 103695]GLY92970.1 molybdenum ABC transporter substrate-binding protein [Actinoplanes sp. NBRC 103695]
MPADPLFDRGRRPGRILGPAAAAVLALAGCSGPPAAEPAPIPAPSESGHHHHHAGGPAPSGAPGGIVVVHAADPLRPTLTRLIPMFEEGFPGITVAVSYGAGTEHVQHIREGAPIDVFVSSETAVTELVGDGLTRDDPEVIARNPVVIAVPETGRIEGVADLARARVAMCAEATECGRSTRAALAAATADVRPATVEPDPAAALSRVRAGAADATLVQRTDLVSDGPVSGGKELRAVEFREANRVADQYAAIRPTTGGNAVGADAFVAFLKSSLVRHVLADAGLSPGSR